MLVPGERDLVAPAEGPDRLELLHEPQVPVSPEKGLEGVGVVEGELLAVSFFKRVILAGADHETFCRLKTVFDGVLSPFTAPLRKLALRAETCGSAAVPVR